MDGVSINPSNSVFLKIVIILSCKIGTYNKSSTLQAITPER